MGRALQRTLEVRLSHHFCTVFVGSREIVRTARRNVARPVTAWNSPCAVRKGFAMDRKTDKIDGSECAVEGAVAETSRIANAYSDETEQIGPNAGVAAVLPGVTDAHQEVDSSPARAACSVPVAGVGGCAAAAEGAIPLLGADSSQQSGDGAERVAWPLSADGLMSNKIGVSEDRRLIGEVPPDAPLAQVKAPLDVGCATLGLVGHLDCKHDNRSDVPLEECGMLLQELAAIESSIHRGTWQAAMLAHRLVNQFKMNRREIAEQTGPSAQRIGQYVHAVDAALLAKSETGKEYTERVGVDQAYASHVVYHGFRGEERAAVRISEILEEAAAGKTSRQIRSAASKSGRARRIVENRQKRQSSTQSPWSDWCFEGDCRELLRSLADSSVKLIHFDPPYGDYRRLATLGADGLLRTAGYSSGRSDTSANLTACANNTADTALALAVDVIKLAGLKLRHDGVLLLWQAGTRPLRIEIQNAIAEAGLCVAFELTLDKAVNPDSAESGQPGNFSEPYTIASEKLIVIRRTDGPLMRCDHDLPRGDVIKRAFFEKAVAQFTVESKREFYSWAMENPKLIGQLPSRRSHSEYVAGRKRIGDTHEMQKPEELCLFLLMKHALPGDLVVDLCGCSGSFCIAADQYDCEWRYCDMPVEVDAEGNQLPDSGNYDFGVGRIAQYFAWKDDPEAGGMLCAA